jgi:signal transduction histidine kinase
MNETKLRDLVSILDQISEINDSPSKFLNTWANIVSMHFNLDYVLIGSLSSSGTSVESIAFSYLGKEHGSFNYDLEFTPCDIVINKSSDVCCYIDDLEQKYPKDPYITKFNLNSYYGCPLYNYLGEPAGIIAFFNEREGSLEEKETLKQFFKLSSKQVGSELVKLQLQETIFHASRLTTLGEFVGGIAHEISNPVTVLSLVNEMAIEELEQETISLESIRKSVSKSALSLVELKEILYNLTNFSRREDGSKDRFSVHNSINKSLNFVNILHTKSDIKFSLDLRAQADTILGRAEKLKQVLTNLINNAIDSLANSKEKEVNISSHNENDQLVIWVTDTGPGISIEIADKIFNSFFTTKEVGRGTGLGLGICRTIIMEMNGDIRLDTNYEDGAKFVIKLPLSLDE